MLFKAVSIPAGGRHIGDVRGPAIGIRGGEELIPTCSLVQVLRTVNADDLKLS